MQTKSQASDVNTDGNGDGTLFLYYLNGKLGYNWDRIIHAKGDTLGEKYQSLTGKGGKEGFRDFIQALPKSHDGKSLALPPDGDPF